MKRTRIIALPATLVVVVALLVLGMSSGYRVRLGRLRRRRSLGDHSVGHPDVHSEGHQEDAGRGGLRRHQEQRGQHHAARQVQGRGGHGVARVAGRSSRKGPA